MKLVTFKIELSSMDDAFQENAASELRLILKDIAQKLKYFDGASQVNMWQGIKDANGNSVGSVEFKIEESK